MAAPAEILTAAERYVQAATRVFGIQSQEGRADTEEQQARARHQQLVNELSTARIELEQAEIALRNLFVGGGPPP